MLKVTSQNLFRVSKEDHTEETAKELDEQGAISTADAEEVVAPIVPDADTTEAGDDIGQATPKEEIGADDKADITQTEDTTPLDGAPVVDATTDDSEQSAEMTELFQEGEQAAATKDEIVQEATAEATGGEASEDTDVNGNAVTEEQAAENAEEEAAEDDVEDEVEEEAAAKDIHQEAAEVDENSDEELGEAINDDTLDAGGDDLGGDTGDVAAGTDDAGTDDLGDLGGDAAEDDDTPLEGAEDLGDSTDTTTDESTPDDLGTDDVSATDTDTTDLGVDDTSTEDPLADSPPESSDSTGDESAETSTDDSTETPDVTEEVEQQNEAADVTAEAASSDADQTAFIADETPEQSGEIPETGDTTVSDDQNNGEEIVAEAEAPATSGDDETTATQVTEEPDAEDDDTPLEGAEELGIDAEEDLTPAGGDMGDSDGSAATVEESTTDQTSEDLQDGLDDVADATAEVEEDAGDAVEETADESPDETSEEVPDETGTVDAEAGEIEETEEPADFEAGEVDVKDVDVDTTDEDVEEAMADAAEVGEWGDAEEKEADIGDKTIEELQKEKESLETFRALLELGIANERYDAGLLAFMNGSVEPFRKKMAALDPHFEDKTPAKVALEDYSGKDLDLAYRATLESFRGMLSRITTATHRISHQVEKWWASGMVDKVKTRADALDKQIDLCLVQLKDADFATGDISGIRGHLSTEETNLVKAVGDDLKLTTDISVKGIKASETFQNNLIKALNDVIGAGSDKEIDKALDAAVALRGTKEAFPSTAFTKGLLGGCKLEIREAGGSSRNDKLEALGHTGIPVGVKSGKTSESSTYKLSKGDIANLLKFAKAYVAIARKLADTTGDRAVSSVSKIRTTRDRALPIGADSRVKGDEQGVDALATAMKLSAQAHVDLYKFITKHCVDVADACCGVAKKAIK